VNLGEFVKNQTPVMSVVRVNPLKVTSEIPEKMTPWIETGQPVQLHVDAFPDKTITGKVSRISPAVNTATRAFPFEALVPNSEGLLKPGTFARVHIESAKIDQVLTLPYDAIQYRYGVNRVFVVDGDHLSARELKVGERLGNRIEVVAGVKPGEVVAVTEPDKLLDGMKVTTSAF
jgi:membrane fusion protein, multidrug efflux system